MLLLQRIVEGNYGEIEMTSVFNISPNFVHRFELVKLTCKTKEE